VVPHSGQTAPTERPRRLYPHLRQGWLSWTSSRRGGAAKVAAGAVCGCGGSGGGVVGVCIERSLDQCRKDKCKVVRKGERPVSITPVESDTWYRREQNWWSWSLGAFAGMMKPIF
jgi:hypothetical protein